MSSMKEVKNALIDVLKADQDLKNFINGNVLEGLREGILDFPCLIIEPLVKDEDDTSYPRQRLSAKFGIVGYLKSMDKDKQLDDVFDFENMVLKAIGGDRRLGGTAEHTMVVQTSYDTELWPVRNFTIQIEVIFEQNSAIR